MASPFLILSVKKKKVDYRLQVVDSGCVVIRMQKYDLTGQGQMEERKKDKKKNEGTGR